MTQNYYLLLGISHDTVKPEVIRVAAETRMNEFKETSKGFVGNGLE